MISFVRSFCLLAAIGEVVHSFFLSFSLSSQVVVGARHGELFPAFVLAAFFCGLLLVDRLSRQVARLAGTGWFVGSLAVWWVGCLAVWWDGWLLAVGCWLLAVLLFVVWWCGVCHVRLSRSQQNKVTSHGRQRKVGSAVQNLATRRAGRANSILYSTWYCTSCLCTTYDVSSERTVRQVSPQLFATPVPSVAPPAFTNQPPSANLPYIQTLRHFPLTPHSTAATEASSIPPPRLP